MRLHHLAFRVGNLSRSQAFYCEILSFDVVRDAKPKSLWLGLGDEAVLMLEARQPGEPPLPPRCLDLAAFRVSSDEKARIRELAVARDYFDGETEHTVYLRDPDGRRVAVSTYPL